MVIARNIQAVQEMVIALRAIVSPEMFVRSFFTKPRVGGPVQDEINGEPQEQALQTSRIHVICDKLQTGYNNISLIALYLDRVLSNTPHRLTQVV